MDYKDLEVWKLARKLAIDVHHMTLNELPKFELFEQGSQIRRSSKSIRANIVEGFGKRRYKMDFIRHLTYALGSARETEDHLLTLWETGSLTNEPLPQSARANQHHHRQTRSLHPWRRNQPSVLN